jgi:hypothetical protein
MRVICSSRRLAMRACAAALCSGFALGASAQALPDQVQVGLERATRTPAELIWLRDEILAELWRKDPRLTDRPGHCTNAGAPRKGCSVGDRPSWRYVFGAGPDTDSRFRPVTSGVYLAAPQAGKTGLFRAPSGEILLAAGTSVRLIDAAYPGIQIELSAPADQPLPLGNLAAADAGRVFGLLVRHSGFVSASAASVAALPLAAEAAPAPIVVVATESAIAPAGAPMERKPEATEDPVRRAQDPPAQLAGAAQHAAATIPPAAPLIEVPPVRTGVQPIADRNPDLARLHAEVEAEIARDRERVAAAIQPCGKPGASLRPGCTVSSPPRRFVFAG